MPGPGSGRRNKEGDTERTGAVWEVDTGERAGDEDGGSGCGEDSELCKKPGSLSGEGNGEWSDEQVEMPGRMAGAGGVLEEESFDVAEGAEVESLFPGPDASKSNEHEKALGRSGDEHDGV